MVPKGQYKNLCFLLLGRLQQQQKGKLGLSLILFAFCMIISNLVMIKKLESVPKALHKEHQQG